MFMRWSDGSWVRTLGRRCTVVEDTLPRDLTHWTLHPRLDAAFHIYLIRAFAKTYSKYIFIYRNFHSIVCYAASCAILAAICPNHFKSPEV
jgi:hypothetical protein